MYVILARLASLVLKQERAGMIRHGPKLHPVILKRFRHMMIAEYAVGALFLVSATPVFWVPTQIGRLRFVLWYSSFLIFFASHMMTKKTESKKK